MSRHRLVFAVLGVAVIGVAFAYTAPISELVIEAVVFLGSDYFFIGLVGLFGLVLALAASVSSRKSNLQQATFPEPEYPIQAPAPGSSLDSELGHPLIEIPVVGRSRRESVRSRLREAAVGTLIRNGSPRQEAIEKVEQGTWTRDHEAGRFLATDPVAPRDSPSVPLVLGRDPPFRRKVRRTLTALEEIDTESPNTPADTREFSAEYARP